MMSVDFVSFFGNCFGRVFLRIFRKEPAERRSNPTTPLFVSLFAQIRNYMRIRYGATLLLINLLKFMIDKITIVKPCPSLYEGEELQISISATRSTPLETLLIIAGRFRRQEKRRV